MPNYDTRVYAGHALGTVSGTTSSLPAGFVLGEERWEGGKKYRLVYNNGNSQVSVGNFAVNIGSTGPYSLTVSSASDVNQHLGAVVCHNATAATGTYFWGLVQGRCALTTGNTSIPTGGAGYVSANGVLGSYTGFTTLPTSTIGNPAVAFCVGAATQVTGMTGLSNVLGGDYRVNLG